MEPAAPDACSFGGSASQSTADAETKPALKRLKEILMLKFIGGTIGAIFLIGLIVVVLLLMLIF